MLVASRNTGHRLAEYWMQSRHLLFNIEVEIYSLKIGWFCGCRKPTSVYRVTD